MGTVQVQLPDDLRSIIDRQVTEGRAASEAEYVAEALRLYADHLDAEDDIAGMVERADAEMASGRFVTLSTPEDSEALHQRTMDRLRSNLSADISAR